MGFRFLDVGKVLDLYYVMAKESSILPNVVKNVSGINSNFFDLTTSNIDGTMSNVKNMFI
jgi:hypothetical protein